MGEKRYLVSLYDRDNVGTHSFNRFGSVTCPVLLEIVWEKTVVTETELQKFVEEFFECDCGGCEGWVWDEKNKMFYTKHLRDGASWGYTAIEFIPAGRSKEEVAKEMAEWLLKHKDKTFVLSYNTEVFEGEFVGLEEEGYTSFLALLFDLIEIEENEKGNDYYICKLQDLSYEELTERIKELFSISIDCLGLPEYEGVYETGTPGVYHAYSVIEAGWWVDIEDDYIGFHRMYVESPTLSAHTQGKSEFYIEIKEE